MSGTQSNPSDKGNSGKPIAKEFPSSDVYSTGNETQGPTEGHEFATDTGRAADEKGKHPTQPAEGGSKVTEERG